MGYFNEARERAERRKSAWNLLLIPAVVIIFATITIFTVLIAQSLHMHNYPGQTLKNSEGVGTILTTVFPIFGAIPLAMLIANFLVWLIPPARRALDLEARETPNSGFISSQKQLIIFASILATISLIFTVIGALLPWH